MPTSFNYSTVSSDEEEKKQFDPWYFDTSVDSEERQMTKAKIYMSLIGIGYLFPFSALTQPVDYWNVLFPDFNIEFTLTAVFMWTNLIFLFLIVLFGGKNPSYQTRIVGGFIGQLIILIFVPSLNFFQISNPHIYYACIMLSTGLVAAVTALLDSVVIGFASHYPPQILEGLQIGIGFSSLIGSVYRILTKLVFPKNEILLSSIIYFYTGALTIGCCIMSYYALISLPISQKYNFSGSSNFSSQSTPSTVASGNTSSKIISTSSNKITNYNAIAGDNEAAISKSQVLPQSPCINETKFSRLRVSLVREGSIENLSRMHYTLSPAHSINSSPHTISSISESTYNEYPPSDNQRRGVDDSLRGKLSILSKVWFYELLVLLTYLTSLTMFPAIITEIPTYDHPELQSTRWWSLLLLLSFSIFDTFGRFMTPYRFGLTHDNIWVAVLLRMLLGPLIYGSLTGILPLFRHDCVSFILTGILGFTNGHLGSVCIMMVSESVPEEEKSIVGGFTGFCLNCGLVFGATLALLMDKYIL
jgi:hypothetical protein